MSVSARIHDEVAIGAPSQAERQMDVEGYRRLRDGHPERLAGSPAGARAGATTVWATSPAGVAPSEAAATAAATAAAPRRDDYAP